MTPMRLLASGTGVGGYVPASMGFSTVPMMIASFTTAKTTRPAARLAITSSVGVSVVSCACAEGGLRKNAMTRIARVALATASLQNEFTGPNRFRERTGRLSLLEPTRAVVGRWIEWR